MLVQPAQRVVIAVAHITLVGTSVPGGVSGVVRNTIRGTAACDKTRGVGDGVVFVETDDLAVEAPAVDT